MLTKRPKTVTRKWIQRGAVTLFTVEAIFFAGSYFIWQRINTERGNNLSSDFVDEHNFKLYIVLYRF